MKKGSAVKRIKSIIKDYGAFNIGEVEGADGICVNEMGGLVALAEGFGDKVTVEVYQPSGFSSDSIETYYVDYHALTVEQVNAILKVAELYAIDQAIGEEL